MTSVRKISHYLYPLNPKTEYRFEHLGKQISTSRENFFKTLDYDTPYRWGIAKNAQKLKMGDMIWVHFALPDSSLGAVGTVAREVSWQSDSGGYAVWIRWDKALTEVLRYAPIPRASYRQVPYFSVLTANERTTAILNRWLGAKQAPESKALEERVRFRTAEVEQRVGQPKFREALLVAYRNQCAVSACAVTEVLQAAHIRPVKRFGTHSLRNGLLLRADLHNLFDRGLLTISKTYIVSIAKDVRSDPQYKKYHGKKLQVLPSSKNQRPDVKLLEQHQELHLD